MRGRCARVDVFETDTQGVKQSGERWLPMQEGASGEVEQAGGDAVVSAHS